MGKISKIVALLLTLTIIMSCLTLLTVKPVDAQSFAKPSVPEFTLKFLPDSENITHTDPFTGAITFEIIDKSRIEVKIKNQPFDNTSYYLYYAIYARGHFDPSNQTSHRGGYYFPNNYTTTPGPSSLQATKTEYTTASFMADYPSHAQIDVTVGAMLMHNGQLRVHDHIQDFVGHLVSGVIQGEVSYTFQTFTIPEHLTSSISSPATATPSSTANEGLITMPIITFGAIITVFVLIIIILMLLIFYRRNSRRCATK
jgi:hypothetical protein